MVRAAGVEPAQPLAGGLRPRGLADAQDADENGCLGRARTSVLRLTAGRPTAERQGKVEVVPEGGVEPPTFSV